MARTLVLAAAAVVSLSGAAPLAAAEPPLPPISKISLIPVKVIVVGIFEPGADTGADPKDRRRETKDNRL